MTKQVTTALIEEKLDLVIQELTTLEEIDGNEYASLSQAEKEKIGYFSRDFGMKHWDWPQGVGIFGLSQLGETYHDYIQAWANEEIKKGIPIANINTICPLLTLMDFPEYDSLCLERVEIIMQDFDRTKEDGLQHNTTGMTKDTITAFPELIWADTIFMTILFLGKMGVKYNKVEWIEEATYQVLLHLKYLLDRETSLFYHAWDFENRSNFGANFWCRGNSWLTMGLPLFIDIMGEKLPPHTRKHLIHTYKNQVEKLLEIRDEKSLLWHTILDDESSYIEASGSAGILSGIYMGLRAGLLEGKDYRQKCDDSIAHLINYINEQGTVERVSAGTIIGNNRDHYKNIIIKPMAYGQAMMLCALVQFLNSRDL